MIYAIIGATCSGKSSLSLQLAPLINAFIFSLDSLSIYKEIDIASAKPSKKDLQSTKHFGINILNPNENANAGIFLELLNSALLECNIESKNLLIVGGSSFYLKSIINGLSPKPSGDISKNSQFLKIRNQDKQEQYNFLLKTDFQYAKSINQNDSYRILKGIEIFLLSGMPPSEFFKKNPPKSFPHKIHCFNLIADKEKLRENIKKRTKNMLDCGIIDEAKRLLEKYGDKIQPFKSIGLKECLSFLNNDINKDELEQLINTHTAQLAKRQKTFNRHQFDNIVQGGKQEILENILKTTKS